ncbi:unnamed protein product [Phytophthora fragariaefolia]|uniref:Unnamed protein product n=1 Tax=Phytophthora fragariaefolia TaxID=1490495 RepID=A0A9W6XP72_9STRA|nr:unnamed protein product [Phytophthora fragariaefolia]
MTVIVTSGERLRVSGIGSVCFAIGESQTEKLTDVLFVPELDLMLRSIPSLVAKGAEVLFQDDPYDIRFGGRLIARVHKEGKLFLRQAKSVGERGIPENAAAAATARPTGAQLWDARLGHIGASRMPSVARAVDGVPVVNAVSDEHDFCDG